MRDADDCRAARHCGVIDRRMFITDTAVVAAALALAACNYDVTGPDLGEPIDSTITVADFPGITVVGGVALVSLNGTPLAIVRTGDTAFLALSRVCPHKGAVVNTSSDGFRCPRHGARFDAAGTWVGGERTTSLRVRGTSYDPATDKLTIV